jgi:leucine-rich repeat protein SHOC2
MRIPAATVLLWMSFFCIGLNVFAQSDEMNFSVANEEQVDSNLDDSIFYNLTDAVKNPLKVSQLILEGKGLKNIPRQVFAFKNLKSLDLSHNRIANLSDSLFKFCPKIVEVRFAGNHLLTVPSALFQAKLKVLDLSENNLTVLSDSIGLCIALEELDLHANDISKLPSDKIILRKLKSLILSENPIGNNHRWVFFQPKVRILFLDETQIDVVDHALCKAVSLKFLNVDGNNFKVLPTCFCNLINLKVLQLGDQFPKMELEKNTSCLPELKIR